MGNYTPIKRPPHLYKATAVTFFAVLTRVLPLLSPLLSGHQALDRLLLALFQEYDGEKQPQKESDDRLGSSNTAPLRLFALQSSDASAEDRTLIYDQVYDEPLLSGQPP